MMKKGVLLLLLVCIVSAAQASDVFIVSDQEYGQGLFRHQGGDCYIITAGHVVADAAIDSDLHVITDNKNKIAYRIIEQYNDDIAILQLEDYYAPCLRKDYWADGKNLTEILLHVREAEIKLTNENGNHRIIPIIIRSITDVDTLTIEPKIVEDTIRPGYSGSPVYVGDVPIGILTSVDAESGVGIVIRQDYLNGILSTFFDPNRQPQITVNETAKPLLGGGFKKVMKEEVAKPISYNGLINKGEILQAVIAADKNSPIILGFDQKGCTYKATVTGAGGNVLLTKKANWAGKLPFTPPNTGNYTIELEGIRGGGEFTVTHEKFTTNTNLQNEQNVLDRNDRVRGKVAAGAVGSYRFSAEMNSPVLLTFNQKDCRYRASVHDMGGKILLRKGVETGTFPFTPPKTGSYKIKIEGIDGAGTFSIGLEDFAHDTELNSPRNVLGRNDSVTGRIANGANGTYKFSAENNSPILLSFEQTGCEYKAVVYDVSGKEVFRKNKNPGTFPFTPTDTGSYTMKIYGTWGYGSFTIGLTDFTSNYSLNSQHNIIGHNDSVTGKIAKGATGEYRFAAEKNSPLLLTFSQENCDYRAVVFSAGGEQVLRRGRNPGTYPFTPPESGEYTIKINGVNAYGEFTIGLKEFTTDAALNSPSNVIEYNKSVTGKIAQGAVGTYTYSATKGDKIEMSFHQTDCDYRAIVYDPDGKEVFKRGRDPKTYPLTVLKTGVYTMKINGVKGYGAFTIGISKM